MRGKRVKVSTSDVIAAVTSADPRRVYQRLEARGSLWWDDQHHAWIASGVEIVRYVLAHPALRVRPPSAPVPPPLAGTAAGDVFSRFARMNDGGRHRQLREGVVRVLGMLSPDHVAQRSAALLASWNPAPTLHELQFHMPVMVMGDVLGVPSKHLDRLVGWTRAFVRATAPNASEADVAAGIAAAPELMAIIERNALSLCADDDSLSRDEQVANLIGLLFQTHDATAGLIGNALIALGRGVPGSDIAALLRDVLQHDAPVQNTRRFAATDVVIGDAHLREGDAVIVVLAAANVDTPDRCWSFGHGAHHCPGQEIALAIASEVVAYARRCGLVPDDEDRPVAYHPSVNARIPDFRDSQEVKR